MAIMEGSGQEIGQLPSVNCTYSDCDKRFKTEKDMKRHKLHAPEHDYCKKCDVDCEDWADLTQHKATMMAEYIYDRNRDEDESPKHITCEFCGEDFKSFGGRKAHRTQMHPADQSLHCPAHDDGCTGLFTRASHLIAHLEQGRCKVISAYEFRASVQHKHVLNEIMKNPDLFVQNLQINKAFAAGNDNPGLITDGTETLDQEEGGVAIFDQDDEEQKHGYKPLQAEVNLIDMNVPLNVPLRRANLERWPRLPGQAKSRLTESVRSMSIGSRAASVSGVSDVTSRRGGMRVYTESYPSLNSPIGSPSVQGDDDTASEATSVATPSVARKAAWTTGQTQKALFKNAKPTPPRAGDWGAILKHREEQALANNKTNLLYSKFYDPGAPDYNPDLFLHSVTLKYCCPFPGCESPYESASDIAAHLQHTHLKTNYVCSTCLKRFTSATAIVGHMESNGRCRVKDSNNYKKVSYLSNYREVPYADVRYSFSTRSVVVFSKPGVWMSRRSTTQCRRW